MESIIQRRKVSILYVQETRWKESKATSTGDVLAVVNTHFRNREEHKVM